MSRVSKKVFPPPPPPPPRPRPWLPADHNEVKITEAQTVLKRMEKPGLNNPELIDRVIKMLYRWRGGPMVSVPYSRGAFRVRALAWQFFYAHFKMAATYGHRLVACNRLVYYALRLAYYSLWYAFYALRIACLQLAIYI